MGETGDQLDFCVYVDLSLSLFMPDGGGDVCDGGGRRVFIVSFTTLYLFEGFSVCLWLYAFPMPSL